MNATSRQPFIRQWAALTSRYGRNLIRDRKTMAVLIGQVPVMAVLIAFLFPGDLLALPDEEPGKSAQFVFILVTASIWLGLITSCREIASEREIVVRELSVGIRLDAYLAAKVAILFVLSAVQIGLLTGIALSLQPTHGSASTTLQLYLVLLATAWASVSLGLAISTLAKSVDQATSFVPLLLIPQLLFAGALVTIKSMDPPVDSLSGIVMARWSFAGAGNSIDLNSRLAESKPELATYGDTFFSLAPAGSIAILIGFSAITLLITGALLARRRPV